MSPVFERLVILGFSKENVVLDNQPNARGAPFSKQITVEIPEGTTHVVPSISGTLSLFGRIASVTDNNTTFVVENGHPDDHHYGLGFFNVHVPEVGRTTATVEVSMVLTDVNADDRWTGVAGVTMLFLGPEQPPGIG
jgi:hypothetical protein